MEKYIKWLLILVAIQNEAFGVYYILNGFTDNNLTEILLGFFTLTIGVFLFYVYLKVSKVEKKEEPK